MSDTIKSYRQQFMDLLDSPTPKVQDVPLGSIVTGRDFAGTAHVTCLYHDAAGYECAVVKDDLSGKYGGFHLDDLTIVNETVTP